MIVGNKIILREKKLGDARNDYTWEANPELAELDAAPPVAMAFFRYLSDYAQELRNPLSTSCRFAIETPDGKHIGNCAYYNISQTTGEAELGIMIGIHDYWSKGYGTDAVGTLLDYIFLNTKLNRIYLKTLESNARAQRCFQKNGFVPYGHIVKDGYNFMLMEISRDQWKYRQNKMQGEASAPR